MSDARRVGTAIEDAAANHLLSLGWTLIARRQKTAHGELDLVAFDAQTLVFVEVRYRQDGSAIQSISAGKRAKLLLAVEEFCAKFEPAEATPIRVDVLLYDGQNWELLRGAIEAD